MLTNCVAFLPAVFGLASRNSKEPRRFLKSLVDLLAIGGQARILFKHCFFSYDLMWEITAGDRLHHLAHRGVRPRQHHCLDRPRRHPPRLRRMVLIFFFNSFRFPYFNHLIFSDKVGELRGQAISDRTHQGTRQTQGPTEEDQV